MPMARLMLSLGLVTEVMVMAMLSLTAYLKLSTVMI